MIIICLICFILGAGIVYLVVRPKLKTTQTLDKETAEKNQTLQTELKVLSVQKDELTNSVNSLQQYANEYYDKNIELATERLNNSLDEVAKKYQHDEEVYKTEYLKTLEECSQDLAKALAKSNIEQKELQDTLAHLRSAVNAAVEAAKREVEKETNLDFYRLCLSEDDISEIKKLREVLPYLRDKEPLNKVIYKVYYEKPYTDLIGRVIGPAAKTGIYKITNIQNKMCYVGQAANVADRWKQHIKRGVGAETPTRNKLYPVMYAIGPENFTFELVEECSRGDLDKREDYWQEYFHAKDFGYSIK